MSPLRRNASLLATLLALISVLAAGLVSAPPASASVVTPADSSAAACSSSFAAVGLVWEPENRIKGFLAAGPLRTGSSTSALPSSVRGFDLFLRLSATGLTVYVNGDPVNLVDPNGHEPQSSFSNQYDELYGPRASVSSARALEAQSLAYANATATHVSPYCVHGPTDAAACGRIEPAYPGQADYCHTHGYSCSIFATLYGPRSDPATADSPWVLDAAYAFEQAMLNQQPASPLSPRNPGLIPPHTIAGPVLAGT